MLQLSPLQLKNLKLTAESFPLALENPKILPLIKELLKLREDISVLKEQVDGETYRQSIQTLEQQLNTLTERLASLKLQKGDKGDTVIGPRGPKGDKGDTTIVEKVIEIQKTEVIREQPIITEITKEVAVPVIDMAEDIRNKLELLTGDERLDKSAIKDLEQLEKDIKDIKAKTKSPGIGGVPGLLTYVSGTKKGFLKAVNFKAGTGVTLTHTIVNGLDTITFTGSASTTAVAEEVVSGSGTSFTLAHTPVSNTLHLYRGGSRITVGSGDYTIVGAAITLTYTLATGETLTADYSY